MSILTNNASMNSNSVVSYTEEERSLFLGDLSCFCREQDIYEFFQECGEIESIRLMRSKTTNKCLGYGFITFVDIFVLPVAMQLYGQVLIGRRIKIGSANPRKTSVVSAKVASMMKLFENRVRPSTKDSNTTTAQVHFSYLTTEINKLITEETIRDIFSQFGEVDDVTIKKSTLDHQNQNGYGFVHFYLDDAGIDAAIKSTTAITQTLVDGVLYDSCLTRSLVEVLQNSPGGRALPLNKKNLCQFRPPKRVANKPYASPVQPENNQFSTYYQAPRIEQDVYQDHRAEQEFFQAPRTEQNFYQIQAPRVEQEFYQIQAPPRVERCVSQPPRTEQDNFSLPKQHMNHPPFRSDLAITTFADDYSIPMQHRNHSSLRSGSSTISSHADDHSIYSSGRPRFCDDQYSLHGPIPPSPLRSPATQQSTPVTFNANWNDEAKLFSTYSRESSLADPFTL